ncbi:MAG: hypothetical protein ABR985_02070 [Methanotrichaceae archaeon]
MPNSDSTWHDEGRFGEPVTKSMMEARGEGHKESAYLHWRAEAGKEAQECTAWMPTKIWKP